MAKKVPKQYNMLKLLHTADWHLGKRLELSERTEEHQAFLDWLILKINEECIDVLVIAGDIFDTGSPSNTALKQYYTFLRDMQHTNCRSVIIIGGNHDSVSTLNAPGDLLKHMKVHVVGGVPDDPSEQIITIANEKGEPELVVCAVPFLRDKDVRLSVAGETLSQMEQRLKEGICDHYRKLIQSILPFKEKGIPVIATGHLFAQGGSTTDSEKEIHVGNLAQICGDQFPSEFDYIALGHLHRTQLVNEMMQLQYSGSPIPLSFSESEDEKVVLIIQFSEGRLQEVTRLPIPVQRKLVRVCGTLEQVEKDLQELSDLGTALPCWVEVQVITSVFIPNLTERLYENINNKAFIERLFIRQLKERSFTGMAGEEETVIELSELSPKEVFRKICQRELVDEDWAGAEQAFDMAIELMNEKDEASVVTELGA